MFTLSLYHQNLNFFSHLQPHSLAYTFCKWGPLILTLLATLLILRFRQTTASLPLITADYDYSDTEDDDHDDESSSISELEDDQEEEKLEERTNECFRMGGSTDDDPQFLRRPSFGDFLSLSEIANTKSVVKLWDSIGFGLGFDRSCSSSNENVVSVYHGEHGLCPNQTVLVSAGENAAGNLAMRVWDVRLRRRIPAVMAEWGSSLGKVVGIESCEVHKVLVRDNGGYGVTVGDIRKAKSPLEKVRDSHWICGAQIHSL